MPVFYVVSVWVLCVIVDACVKTIPFCRVISDPWVDSRRGICDSDFDRRALGSRQDVGRRLRRRHLHALRICRRNVWRRRR